MEYTPEVLLLELVDKRKSGWIREGTEGTPFQDEKNSPTTFWVANTSTKTIEEEVNGRKIRRNIKTRYIKGCDSIIAKEQDDAGFKPNSAEDHFVINDGFATIVKEGEGIGLYNFMVENNQNEDYEFRPQNVPALWRAVKLDKTAELIHDADEVYHDAMEIIISLRQKKGDTTVYNEAKIEALSELFGVFGANTAATKLSALSQYAKAKPQDFIEKVTAFQNLIATEVAHAFQYNIIKLNNSGDGTIVEYSSDNKIVKTFGSEKLKKDEVSERLIEFLGSSEGNQALSELRIALEVAKQKALTK